LVAAGVGPSTAQQQQQQQQDPVWLRVQDMAPDKLLDTRMLQQQGSCAKSANGFGSSSSNNGVGGGSSSSSNGHASVIVQSWLTTAVFICSATAKDMALTVGSLVRINSSSGHSYSSSSSGALPLQSLVVVLLLDESVAWGHIAVARPLQQCLAAAVHQYIKLQPLQQQAQQLQQLPGFVLHPLLPAQPAVSAAAGGVAAGSSSSVGSGSSNAASSSSSLKGAVGAAAGLGEAVAAAAARGSAGGAGGGAGRSGPSRCSISEIEELPHLPSTIGPPPPSAASSHHQQQQDADDSFTGMSLMLGLVTDLVSKPLHLLNRSSSKELSRPSSRQSCLSRSSSREGPQHLQQQQQQQEQPMKLAGAELLSPALQQPGVKSAAMTAWLQLQLLGVTNSNTAAAAAAAGVNLHHSSSSGSSSSAMLPCCGPLLVHFRLCKAATEAAATATNSQQQQQQPDYLMLLIPHSLPAGALAPGSSSSSNAFLLPGQLLESQQQQVAKSPSSSSAAAAAATVGPQPVVWDPPGQRQQQQQHSHQLDVLLGGTLTYDAAAAVLVPSPVAAQHRQHITFIADQGLQAEQQQQQQQLDLSGYTRPDSSSSSLLAPADYPWLAPAVDVALARLRSRLSLLTWQAWQDAGVPLPGGVLLVGSSDSGRAWLLQLLGQKAAAEYKAHVLKVTWHCLGFAAAVRAKEAGCCFS
jgi:hypothetical protein